MKELFGQKQKMLTYMTEVYMWGQNSIYSNTIEQLPNKSKSASYDKLFQKFIV